MPAFLAPLLAGLGSAATAVAANPLAQQAALGAGGYLAQGLGNRLSNWFNGPQAPAAPGLEQLAQQYYLNQIQQPVNIPYAQQQQQMVNQFNQQTVPGLLERFTGAGGQRSSAFGQQLGAGGSDLMQALEALREQSQLQEANINQGRLGQLGGYLAGQQGLGLQAQQLAQQGTIANREAQLRAMGLMQQANQFQQGQNLQQLLGRGELQGRLAGLGLGRKFDVLRHGGQPGYAGQAAQAGLNAGINYLAR